MRRAVLISAVLILTFACAAWASNTDLTSPVANGKEKWRIAYMEGGAYGNFQWNLKALILGLRQLDWVQIPDEFENTAFPDEKSMWEWLGQNAKSDFLEFVQDAFWSANWDKAKRLSNKEEAIARLSGKHDIDLVIALGTWAGQDLANDRHSTTVVVLQSADPVRAGIVKSAEYSGMAHIFAHCDPDRYKRQIKFFHSVVQFSKLGVAFEDTPDGRIYVSMKDILEVCGELGVDVVECHTITNTSDRSLAFESYKACHERLAREVDAMYITNSASVAPGTLPSLVQPFIVNKIPTLAQMGYDAVRYGALLGVGQGDHKPIGLFYARTISQLLHGAKAGSLPQIFAAPLYFALNMDTAKAIGFTPPAKLLGISVVIQNDR